MQLAYAIRASLANKPAETAAYDRLLAQGLVEAQRNRGFFVRRLAVEEVREVYYVRAALFGLAGRLLAERGVFAGKIARLSSDPARVALMLRVPADKLDGVIEHLKGLGTVDALDVRAEDVTSQRVDLDARIKALQTSVDRLLAIMRDARDPSALIEAENALSQRQADLDSLRAQRAALGDQIALSTVTVDLVAPAPGGPAPRQYQGFFGQVERGWDALVDTGTQMFLLVGLMLPWVGAALVLLAVVYAVIRVARLRR